MVSIALWVDGCSYRRVFHTRFAGIFRAIPKMTLQLTAFFTSAPILASLAAVQLRQRERGRPHDAFVEVRLVAGAECRVPRLELLRASKEADDVPVLGIRGHPIPGL